MNENKILEILKNALLLEYRGRTFYRRAKEESKVEEVKNIFDLMEREEEKHIDFLNKEFNWDERLWINGNIYGYNIWERGS